MTKITLAQTISDADFAAIERFAANVTTYWPELNGATITVERDSDELSVSVSGCDELKAATLQQSVLNELEVLRHSASIGW